MCTNVQIKIITRLHYHDCICTVNDESVENIYLLIHPARNGVFFTNQAR